MLHLLAWRCLLDEKQRQAISSFFCQEGCSRKTESNPRDAQRWHRTGQVKQDAACPPDVLIRSRAYHACETGRLLPGSIGPEEAKDGALMDRQIQHINGAVRTKVFGEPRCLDG